MILFLSSAFFPANLMLEPAATDRRVQPAVSFIVEGVRELVVSTLSAETFWKAAAALAGIAWRASASRTSRLRSRLRTGG